MSDGFMKLLKRVVENPYLNIIVSLFLLFSGISETVREFKELKAFRIGVHHGVILFALLQLLKSLPDLFEGLEYIGKAGEEKHQ